VPDNVAPFIAVAVAVLGAGIGFIFRGQIRGSSADKLWDVTEKLRQEQAEELKALRGENRDHERRIAELEKENTAAMALADQLRREKEWKDDLISRQAVEIAGLRTENATLRTR
jgi:hypothetical protein